MNHKEATSMFLQGSRRYPVSVVAQAAYVTDYLLSNGLQSSTDLYLLAATRGPIPDRMIRGLVRLALYEHEKRNITGVVVNEEKMREIIMHTALFSQQFFNYRLTSEQLAIIMHMYQHHHRYRKNDPNENAYRKAINERLRISI